MLLFAGALHVDLSRLRAYRWQVGALAVGSTVLSTALVGAATWLVFPLLGVDAGSVEAEQGERQQQRRDRLRLAPAAGILAALDRFFDRPDLIDELLNAVLFVLIGMEVVLVSFSGGTFVAAAAAIVLILSARALTVGVPVALMNRSFKLPQGAGWVLTWGGLRGGISVALALSLPAGPQRDIVLALTYCVVVFSILGQGLTLGRVIRASLARVPDPPSR